VIVGGSAVVNHAFPFFILAHLAFTAATIMARASGLKWRFFLGAALAGADVDFLALTAAHRAFCAATIRARPAADMPPFLLALATEAVSTGPASVYDPAHRSLALYLGLRFYKRTGLAQQPSSVSVTTTNAPEEKKNLH